MASNKKKSAETQHNQPDQLVELVKTIADKISGGQNNISEENINGKKIGEFAQMVADKISGQTKTNKRSIATGSTGTSDFQGEVLGLLRNINETVKKNDPEKFLANKLSGILQKVHQENVIWDENRADNRSTQNNNKQDELIQAIKNLKTATPNTKTRKEPKESESDGTKSGGGLFSKIGGVLGGGLAGIGSIIAGSIFGGGALYHLTGGDKPNEIQSVGRGASHFALRTGAKKLTQLSTKLGAKRIRALRQLAKSPASKIIRESVKKMTRTLPKTGAASKLLAPARKVLTRTGTISGVGKAIGKTGIRGVAKAGKLASKAKWLGKAAKLSKFGGKLLPGVGTALSVYETIGHIRNGNYGRAALSGISAVGSLIPGVGTVVSGVADAVGTGWDVFSAWKRRKERKQKEQADAVKKENREQKDAVRQAVTNADSKAKSQNPNRGKSDKLGAMASVVDSEIKKNDKSTENKFVTRSVGAAKKAFKYATLPGLAMTTWKNRKRIGGALSKAAKKVGNSKVGNLAKSAFKYATLPGLAMTAWKNRDKIGAAAASVKGKAVSAAKTIANSVGILKNRATKFVSGVRSRAGNIVKTATKRAANIVNSSKRVASKLIGKAPSIIGKALPLALPFGMPVYAAHSLWKNRKRIASVGAKVGSRVKGVTKKIANSKLGKPALRIAENKPGKIINAFNRANPIAKPKTPVSQRTTREPTPNVSAITSSPRVTPIAQKQETNILDLGNVITNQLTKTRDSDAEQTKKLSETFISELEKVCSMLAQINATLPELQPAPPPPVQQVVQGNNIPEFRKHNLEAIA